MTDSPPRVRIYTKRWCAFCMAATRLFDSLGVPYQEIPVDGDPELRRQASDEAGGWPTVPMIFIDERFIGGYTDARALEASGELQVLLEAVGAGRS